MAKLTNESLFIAGADSTDEPTIYTPILMTEEEDILNCRISEYVILEDYATSFSEEINMVVLISAGIFQQKIKPFKDNLEIAIVHNRKVVNRYKAVIANDIIDSLGSMMDTDELGKLDTMMLELELQLINLQAEGLSTCYYSNIHQDAKVKDVISVSLQNAIDSMSISSSDDTIDISIIEPNNDREYGAIVVPQDTLTFDVPARLHHKEYGVYNGGIGTFLKRINDKNTIFVFPLYGGIREHIPKKIMRVITTNDAKMSMSHVTHRIEGDILNILSTPSGEVKSFGEKLISNHGESFTAVKSSSIITSKKKESGGEGSITDKEFYIETQSLLKKKDGAIRSMRVGITDNFFLERSKILKNLGVLVNIPWKNSDRSLVIPGMAVEYLYEESDTIKTLYGTVVGLATKHDSQNGRVSSSIAVFLHGNTQ